MKIDGETEEGIAEYQLKMPGLCQKSAHHSHSSSTSTSSGGGSVCNARNGIWSRSRDDITFAQLHRFWSELPSSARQELLRIDKQSLFEQVRKNLYCSRCNGLLLEVFSQIVHYGKSIQQEAAYANIGGGPGQYRNHNEIGSKLTVAISQDDTSDPSVHPWGGLTTTRDGVLTLLDCFLVGTSLEALQNVFDSARARERERELLYPDACGGGGRGWISQGTSTSGRGHGMKETCALHTARLSCEALVDFWSALGEETRSSLLRMKEEDFIERLMFRFDSKRFCRDCRRNVLREFKELKELKRTRREPRCTIWFCVADTAFQYEVSDSAVQADWHECFAEAGGMYQRFEWAVGTGEGKSDIFGFEDVGLCGNVQADGLALDNIVACYITLRAWKHDGRCTEISVKAHSLEGRLCVHRRLIVGDGYVTITKGESIRRFFEHAEETEEEEDEDSNDKEGNDLDAEGSRPQKHAKSPELARDFLLDAATVIFKEQVEKAFREGTARQNAHSIFVCLALGLLEERVHVACKEIITLEKQNKLLEEEAAEKREEEERKERKRLKEREKKLRRKEKLKEREREKDKNNGEFKHVSVSHGFANGTNAQEEQACHSVAEDAGSTNDDTIVARSASPDMLDARPSMDSVMETGDEKEEDMSFSVTDMDGEVSSRDGNGAFIVGQSKSARRKSKIRKSPILETASVRIFRKGPTSIETNIHVRSSERLLSNGYVEIPARSIHSMQKQPKNMKSDNSGKADNRSNTVKCYEKFHWCNGRPHYRYDYQFCGCNPQSSNKPTRDSRIADRSDSSLDMSKSFYRIGNHIPGPILDNCGAYKGKTPAGMVSGGRGEVHHKKVWEPLESRHQAIKCPAQSNLSVNSIAPKSVACDKGENSDENPIQPSAKRSSVRQNNTSGTINGWSPSGAFVSYGSERYSSVLNSCHCESDKMSNTSAHQMNNVNTEQASRPPIPVSMPTENHVVQSTSNIPAKVDSSRQRRDGNGCMVTPSSQVVSEKIKCPPITGDFHCVSENGCGGISSNGGSAFHVPCSKPSNDEAVDRQEGNSQFVVVSSPVLNHIGDNLQKKGPSTSHANDGGLAATKNTLTTLEMTPQQQVLPVHIPTISSPMFPLHSPNQGYYQCSGAWPPVSGNGLLPFPQPNRFVFPGPGGFGLSSGRLPGFSLPYPSFQPFPSVLAPGQIPSLLHKTNAVKFDNRPNPSRSVESEIEDVKICPGINIPHQEKHIPLQESSNGFSLSEVSSSQQEAISSNSPTHDISAFSLFHFGGPAAAVTKESDSHSSPLREEIMGDSLTSKETCAVPPPKNDFAMHKEKAPVEEYSLFAASHGNRFGLF